MGEDSFTISVNTLYTVLFALGAFAAAILFAHLRRKRALAWLVTALAIGALQIWNVGRPQGEAFDFLSAAILVPAAFLAMAQALRHLLDQDAAFWKWRSAALGLTIASIGAYLLEMPHFLAFATFIMTLGMLYLEMIQRLRMAKRPNLFYRALLVLVSLLLLAECVRIVATPIALGFDFRFDELYGSGFDRRFLVVIGLLQLLFVSTLLASIAAKALIDMRFQAERDYLTGLYNRGTFEDRMMQAMQNDKGVLLLADLDHFKQVNDRYGHLMGDGAICVFADLAAKAGGVAGRIGGEEFAILLPNASPDQAHEIANDLRAGYSEAIAESLAVEEPLSVSIGCAPFKAGQSPAEVHEQADQALYAAKRGGRNRVVCAA